MSKATIYLGETALGTFIYADITLKSGDKTRVLTDHSEGIVNEVSISFTELKRRCNPRTAPDSMCVSVGQIPAEDRIIRWRSNKLSADSLELIERAWADDHLNTMRAACDHMTPDMLNPSPEQLAEYIAKHPRTPSYSALSYYRLDHVVCPDTGYKYGHAWLAKAPSAADYAALAALINE